MKNLEEMLLDIEGLERPHRKKAVEVHTVAADLKQIQAEITFILTNCVRMLREEDEELRERAAQELEDWLRKANPVKH